MITDCDKCWEKRRQSKTIGRRRKNWVCVCLGGAIFLNWNIVILQCWISFSYTAKWFSYIDTYVCIYIYVICDIYIYHIYMPNLYSILKSRDITLPTKVHLVEAMIFPVLMYGCESCTIKKAECQRIDAFELWYWRRLLRVPWTARRTNQSILKEINPEYSLEGLMPKLKLQYFGHLRRRTDSFEKTLMLGKIEGRRRRGR